MYLNILHLSKEIFVLTLMTWNTNKQWHPNNYFKNVKVINFDLIHHHCRGNPLEKTENEHYAIQKIDFKKYKKISKKEVVGAALRTQNETKQPLFVKKEVAMKHFLNKW